MHLRGDTKLHPAVPEENRGTFSGLLQRDVVERSLVLFELAKGKRRG